MLNKLVGASLLAVICSPIFANEAELALTPESAEKCINVYDKIYNIQDALLTFDLRITNEYSHFRVAQENYNKAFYKRDEIETKLATLSQDDPELLVHTKLWNDANEIVIHWDNTRIVELSSMQDVMYSRHLKTERLKRLRTTSLRCKGHVFDKKEVKEICSAKTESQWCEGRF